MRLPGLATGALCALLFLIGGAPLWGQDELADEAPSAPAPGRQFEVLQVGSGTPQLLVWFGPKEPSGEELSARGALADELRRVLVPGEGSVHLVVDLGPSASTPAFGLDFPIVQAGPATRFQPRCFARPDSRALASYLVANPRLAGLVALPPERPGIASAPGGNLPGFLRIGLGLLQRVPRVPAPQDGQSQVQVTAGVLRELLARARARLMPAPGAATHLGGELWQVDLELTGPQLNRVQPDPARTYPATRLRLDFQPVTAPVAEGDSAPESPKLIELAWRAPGEDAFKRLALRAGAFTLPLESLPKGAELRVVARVPGSMDALEVRLDTGRAGLVSCRVPLGREAVTEEPPAAE